MGVGAKWARGISFFWAYNGEKLAVLVRFWLVFEPTRGQMAPSWSGVGQKLVVSLFLVPACIHWWWAHVETLQLGPDLGPKKGPGNLPVPFQVPLTDRKILAAEMFGNVFSAASGGLQTHEKVRKVSDDGRRSLMVCGSGPT